MSESRNARLDEPQMSKLAPNTLIVRFSVVLFLMTACGDDSSPLDASQDTDRDATTGTDAAPDAFGGYPPPTDETICADPRCPMPRTHWDPYALSCITDPSIDVQFGRPVCGCDGVTYPAAGFAARRGVRTSEVGVCGDTLTPCGERPCTSMEFCDMVDCDSSAATCLPKPDECAAPEPSDASCGCDDQWYPSACLQRMAGVSTQFDDAQCGQLVPSEHHRVFFTRAVMIGDFGGIEAADATCQAEATGAGLPGTWRAFLADSSHSPSDFVPSDVAWTDMVGNVLFVSTEALLHLQVNYDYEGHGTYAEGEELGFWDEYSFWTGFRGEERLHCADWRSGSANGYASSFNRASERLRFTTREVVQCSFHPERGFMCLEI